MSGHIRLLAALQKNHRDHRTLDLLVRFHVLMDGLVPVAISEPSVDNVAEMNELAITKHIDIDSSQFHINDNSLNHHNPTEINEDEFLDENNFSPMDNHPWHPYPSLLGIQAGNAWGGPSSPVDRIQKGNALYINQSSAYPPDYVSHLTESPRPNVDFSRVEKLEKTDVIPSVEEYKHMNDSSRQNFFHRNVREEDMKVLKDLHVELFPVPYQDSFYNSILQGEIPTTLLCWAADEAKSVDHSSNPIVAFACLSPEFPPDDSILHPVGVSMARRELLTVIKYLAYKEINKAVAELTPIDGTMLEGLLASIFEEKLANMEEIVDQLIGQTEYILTFGVMQEFRRKGLASGLIAHLQRDGVARGKKIILLHVVDYNESALNMYKTNGFDVLEHYPNYYSFLGQVHGAYFAAWISPVGCPELDRPVSALVNDVLHAYRLRTERFYQTVEDCRSL